MRDNSTPVSGETDIFKDWIVPILVALVLAFFIKKFIFQTAKVEGLSMQPTFDSGDRLISTNIPYYFSSPKKGDVIVFKSPYNEKEAYIKRVIATEGDDVRIDAGNIYINGQKLEEDYLNEGQETYPSYNGTYQWTVDKDAFYALGDNRDNSSDSRDFGSVTNKNIIGKVIFRFWPINKIGVVKK